MKKLSIAALSGIVLLLGCSEPASVPPKPTISSKLESVLTQASQHGDFMGSAALVKDGKVIFSKSVGFDDIQSAKASSNASVYRLGSLSKTFTAVLVFKAIEEGKLALEQDISAFFPDMIDAKDIRIIDLLQHRSGLENFTRDKAFFQYHTDYQSRQQMLNRIFGYPRNFKPDTQAQYSNSNYYFLGVILEKIYAKKYGVLIAEKIVQPLGLSATYEGKKINPANAEANSYKFAGGWQVLPETDMSITFGAGSIVSTATDAALFLDALFSGNIISLPHVEQMKEIKDSFGLGLKRYYIRDRYGFGHRGTLDGFKSTAIYFVKDKVSLVLLSNGNNDNINTHYQSMLKVYFDDAPIAISAQELAKFAGTYRAEGDEHDVVMQLEANKLMLVFPDGFKSEVIYKGKGVFVLEQLYAESMIYNFESDGSKLYMEQAGKRSTIPHVKVQ